MAVSRTPVDRWRGLLAALGAAAALGGVVRPSAAQPAWWVSLGVQLGIETGQLTEGRETEAGAAIGAGLSLRQLGRVLVSVEAEGSANRAKDRVDTRIEPREDTVDLWRGRLGLRATFWEEHDEPRLVPYLRAGAIYRSDRITRRDDDGFGWYGGAGLDLRLGEHWALGPFATYEEVWLRHRTRGLLFGLGLTFWY